MLASNTARSMFNELAFKSHSLAISLLLRKKLQWLFL